MPTHVAVGSPSPHSNFVPCTFTDAKDCGTQLQDATGFTE